MHVGSMTSAVEMCEALVAKINALDSDLVIFGGDLVNARYDELSPELMEVLSGIKARDGVVAVLGNHDTGVYVRDTVALPIEENTRLLIERIESMGWRVVDDSTESLMRGCDTLTLTGIGFSRELLEHRHSADVADSLDLRPIYEGVPRDKFNISVSHMPQLWRKISALGYGDLVLSGHVHAMQLRLPLGTRGWSPAAIVYKHWSGLYQKDGCRLFVSDGIGGGVPFRIGARPQIVVITLKKNV
jgi:predicted MPP superfamily phosphohydrolase